MCLPSVAPLSYASFLHYSSDGCHNSVGDNLLQIALQVDMIIECTAEGAILQLKLIDIWEFPEARNLKINTTVFNK
jgi:hypothetical protein